jgi:hypothetical protein
MTVNQETEEMLTPEEVEAIVATVQEQRERPDPFDVAVNVALPADPLEAVEAVRPYQEAGATWCVTLSPATVAAYRDRIRSGPPQL